MHLLLRAFFLNIMAQVSTRPDSGICSDVSNGDPLRCCTNYQVVDKTCKECPLGTYGIDCQEHCPSQFYGRLCKEVCSCDPCDKISGCLNITKEINFTTMPGVITKWLPATNSIDVKKEDGTYSNVSNGDTLECCVNHGDRSWEVADQTSQKKHHWLTILTVTFAGFAVCLLLCHAIICIFRWNKSATVVIQNP